MAEAFAFDEASKDRIVAAVGQIEAGTNPRPYRGRGPVHNAPIVDVLRVTSATPDAGKFPAKLLFYDPPTNTWSDGPDIWAVDPAGGTLAVGKYGARAIGVHTDDKGIYAAFSNPSGGGGGALTELDVLVSACLVDADGNLVTTVGSVNSVGLAAPAEFTVSGSPVTTSGTLTFTKANQAANLVYAGPASGAAAPPTHRSLVHADLPLTKAEAKLAADFAITSANGTFVASGLSITLPVAGTYQIEATIRGLVNSNVESGSITAKLVPSLGTLTDTESLVVFTSALNLALQGTTRLFAFFVATAATTIEVQVKRDLATTWISSSIISDSSGWSKINYIRLQ
jgi:hypothetical protein